MSWKCTENMMSTPDNRIPPKHWLCPTSEEKWKNYYGASTQNETTSSAWYSKPDIKLLKDQHNIEDKCFNKSNDNENNASLLWRQKSDSKISKTLSKFDSKMTLHRPSTAVRQHVKKISEDFTVTQIKYKNSLKPNGIIIKFEPSEFRYMKDKMAAEKINTLSPLIKNKIFRKETTCTKCSSKHHIIPMVNAAQPPAPPVSQTENNKISISISNLQNGPSRTSSRMLRRQESLLASPSLPSTCSKHRRIQKETAPPTRSFLRRKSQSANAGIANGVLKVPFEQVKKAKLFAEKAVKEGKVFSIHGGFPAIREALMKRGWVEKVLHNIPYVNPHPQNCVCAHVGWHMSSSNHSSHHHHYHHSSHNSPTSESSTNSSSDGQQNGSLLHSKLSENGKREEMYSEMETKSDQDQEIMDKDKEFTEVDYVNNNADSKQKKITRIAECEELEETQSEDCVTVDSYMNPIFGNLEENVPGNVRSLESQICNQENEEIKFKTPYFQNLTKRINTSILGPSEIREGLQKTINPKNLAIFQYSVPPYENKNKSCSRSHSETQANYCHVLEEKDYLETQIDNGAETKNRKEEQSGTDDNRTYEKEQQENDSEKETKGKKFNPFPELEYILTKLDKPVVARVLRNVEPNFIWSWNRDSISYKHLSKDQLVNRFPNTPFTTKYGLCETLQQLHWFSEAACVDTFVPRGYCIGHEDERSAFIHDYRTTACLNILKWLTEESAKKGLQAVAHPLGEVPLRRVRQALQHIEQYIQSCCHDDVDSPPLESVRENEWELILTAHHRIIHQGKRIKALSHHGDTLLRDCRSALERVEDYWPQLKMDGVRNVWIVKPGAQSRGRGIFLLNQIEEILALVQSPLIYQTKYVVQKYMERPLLIHNTKFDIRQWFIVTDWNPLTLWMYKESYLRFCSQQYDLTNNDEAIHLSNNAIQCKYLNGERDKELPEENMWDCNQFKEYLRSQGKENAYEEIIHPGMKDALIATMLAAQVQMDSFKHGFEFFGADFMLTEDLKPWLIEINSSPCMASTTSVTKRMCYESLNDTIKVVVDYRQNKSADTGKFELIYQDKEKSVASLPYYGVALQVVGRQIWKPAVKPEKRRVKKPKSLPKVVKSIPLITLQLKESGDVCPAKPYSFYSCQNNSSVGPTLASIVPSHSQTGSTLNTAVFEDSAEMLTNCTNNSPKIK